MSQPVVLYLCTLCMRRLGLFFTLAFSILVFSSRAQKKIISGDR